MKTIMTKYLPATNFKPSRIKASIPMGNKADKLTISYHSIDGDPHRTAARQMCLDMGWYGTIYGGQITSDVYVWVFGEDSNHDQFTVPKTCPACGSRICDKKNEYCNRK